MYSQLPNYGLEQEEDPVASYRDLRASEVNDAPHKRSFCSLWKAGYYTIIPEDNLMVDIWDVLVIVALFATAIELPFEIALLRNLPPGLYYSDKAIDIVFTLDIFLNFNIAFARPHSGQDIWERRPLRIAQHYVLSVPFTENLTAGWFWPDVLTVFPWEIFRDLPNMKSVRLVRVLRLVRMLRLMRVIKLFKRWHMHSGFSFALIKIATTAVTTMFLLHWLSCFWAHLGIYPEYYSPSVNGKAPTSWLHRHLKLDDVEGEDHDLFKVYSTSLYLCTVVLTTVGFGDIVPVNDVEVILMILTIILSGITWSWVVASVVDVMTNMDIFGTQFNQIMDDLNGLMSSHGVNRSLRYRIRSHLHESYSVFRRRHNQKAIHWLSDGLQGELAIQSGVDKVCDKIWYFNAVPMHIKVELADDFRPEVFSPGELIGKQEKASVIIRGSCVRKGRILTRDYVVGADFILASEWLRDASCPRALTFCEMMSIHREVLREVCYRHPEFDRHLRRAQVRLAVWRGFVFAAKEKASKGARRSSQWDSSAVFGRTITDKGLSESERGWADSVAPNREAKRKQDETMSKFASEMQGIKLALAEAMVDTKKNHQVFETRLEEMNEGFTERFAAVEDSLHRVEELLTTHLKR